jgi:hypothetical protein
VSKDRSISGGTATATGGFQAGRGASANRLPSAPRERKPALAALAVLLILAGALSTMLLVTRSGNRVDVVMMKNTLTVGQQIDPDRDLKAVSVAADNSIPYIKWEQRYDLRNRTTYNALVQGSILMVDMLGQPGKSSAPSGTTVVGIVLKPGHYPFRQLFPNDTVTVLGPAPGGTSGTTGSTPAAGGSAKIGTAQIVAISGTDTLSVTLAAPSADIAEKIALAGDSVTVIKTIAG